MLAKRLVRNSTFVVKIFSRINLKSFIESFDRVLPVSKPRHFSIDEGVDDWLVNRL